MKHHINSWLSLHNFTHLSRWFMTMASAPCCSAFRNLTYPSSLFHCHGSGKVEA